MCLGACIHEFTYHIDDRGSPAQENLLELVSQELEAYYEAHDSD